MRKNSLFFQLVVFVMAMMCALGARADEVYACYTSENTTLTFYYDSQSSSRPGVILYDDSQIGLPNWCIFSAYYAINHVVFDPSFANYHPTSTRCWFMYMDALESITGIEYLNTSNVTDMINMFYDCSSLTDIDVSGFNTANVTNMRGMFDGCTSLKSLDVSKFNTVSVTDMSCMFRDCSSLTSLGLSGFNTANETDMEGMFNNCTNLSTIYVGSGWSTNDVTESTDMFLNCTKLVGGQGTTYSSSNPSDKTYADIDGGLSNPGYLTELKEAYACYTSENGTLTFYYDIHRSNRAGSTFVLNTGDDNPDWDPVRSYIRHVVFYPSFAQARPTSTYHWFWSMRNLQDITGMKEYLNTSEVTNMRSMFGTCENLSVIDVSNFNTDKVTDMYNMFGQCSSVFVLDVSHFNTSNVTEMRGMFSYCSSLAKLDLSSFDLSKVSDMRNFFDDCSNLRTIYATNDWSTASVTTSNNMFRNCTKLRGGKGTTYNESNPTDKTYAHVDYGTSNPGYFSEVSKAYACYTSGNRTLTFYYDTLRVTRPGKTYDLNTGTDITEWENDGTNDIVTKVVFDPSFAGARPTTTYSWFYNMSSLQSITGMNYLNTSEVTEMSWMFCGCRNMTSLDLSSFNTSKVTSMWGMFIRSTSLKSLDLSSFNTSNVNNMSTMFSECTDLRTIFVGNDWSTAAVTSSSAMFYDCPSLVGAHIDGGPSNPGYLSMPGQAYVSLEEALNVEGGDIEFYNDADCPWFVMQIDGQKDDRIYAQSGNAGIRNSVSTLIAYVTAGSNGATLSFDFKAWGEGTHYDVCIFEIDGTEQFRYGALQNDWETYTVQLTPGEHELLWSYQKDGSVDPEGDYFAIDNVKVNSGLRGDVNGVGGVDMDDLTALINYLLTSDATGINLANAAICNSPSSTTVDMDDLTALINYLLDNTWQ